jgi:N-carbamoyl-L-amino-acid hydrolase
VTHFGALAERINSTRLWDRHEQLATFGATSRGGVNRQALSNEEFAARRQLLTWAEPLGLTPTHDPAGNLFFRYPGRNSDLAPVLCGSHIDSQPTGGKYDGVSGVLAALEAAEVMRETGLVPERPIEIVAWMNEEGSRFAPGMMGSEAFARVRPLDAIRAVRDANGVMAGDELDRLFTVFPEIPVRPLGFAAAAFVELHIEQGPVLDAARIPIGVVSGIQGKKTYKISVFGEEAHAGTTPRSARRDALRAAAAMIDTLHREIVDADDVVRFTVGRVNVEPNAPSVVPAKVSFSVDLRHPEGEMLDGFALQLERVCTELAAPCTADVERLVDAPPLTFASELRDLIRETADRLALQAIDLPSAAGHDARNLNTVCPTAMIFVPCKDGISHNEAESVLATDLVAGTKVLAEVTAQLASR